MESGRCGRARCAADRWVTGLPRQQVRAMAHSGVVTPLSPGPDSAADVGCAPLDPVAPVLYRAPSAVHHGPAVQRVAAARVPVRVARAHVRGSSANKSLFLVPGCALICHGSGCRGCALASDWCQHHMLHNYFHFSHTHIPRLRPAFPPVLSLVYRRRARHNNIHAATHSP